MDSITTTNGESFSYDDHCRMAWLIHLRFGRSIEAGAAGWRRLMQNSCTDSQFEAMVNQGAFLAVAEGGRV